MLEMTPELFDRVYQVNPRALASLSQAAALRTIEQVGGGKVINIASSDLFHPSMVRLAAYDASKGGVRMFTEALALELGPRGNTVNGIAPDMIATEGAARPASGGNLTPEQLRAMTEEFLSHIPLRRMGAPDDIAKVAVFLASTAAD